MTEESRVEIRKREQGEVNEESKDNLPALRKVTMLQVSLQWKVFSAPSGTE
jgi:hypothetical protein